MTSYPKTFHKFPRVALWKVIAKDSSQALTAQWTLSSKGTPFRGNLSVPDFGWIVSIENRSYNYLTAFATPPASLAARSIGSSCLVRLSEAGDLGLKIRCQQIGKSDGTRESIKSPISVLHKVR